MKPYASYKRSGVPWLGDVPAHWRVNSLRHVLVMHYGDALAADMRVDGDVPVYGSNGVVGTHNASNTDAPTIIVGRKGSYGKLNFSESAAFCIDTAYHIGQNDCDGCSLRFIFYALMPLGLDTTSQDTGVPGLSREVAYRTKITVPPPGEQQAIADYLDVETARIDTLIHEKDELIGLLREWRQSVIAEYTSGATQSQGRKATGNVHMPWIPSDWSMVRLGKYARIGNGSTPLKDNASYWDGGTFPWLNSAVVNRDTVDEGSEYVTDVALRACHLPIVEPGALLVALTGQGKTRGQVTVLRIQATINQHLAYLALDEARFDTNFLFWALTGMYAALRMVSDGQGGTKGALTCDDLARFEVPMPSLTVQQEIASAVSRETTKIDDLIAHTHDEITLLKELRAATIADAVLGRIDVRGSAKTIASCA